MRIQLVYGVVQLVGGPNQRLLAVLRHSDTRTQSPVPISLRLSVCLSVWHFPPLFSVLFLLSENSPGELFVLPS